MSAPTPRSGQTPRIVVYQQTHFKDGQYVSLLPLLLTETAATHVIVGAIHLNDRPGDITLNDDPYDCPRNAVLWQEVQQLQAAGVAVLGMLGGAARGTYARLDADGSSAAADARFESFYAPLRELVLRTGLDGLDLDVEEDMSLSGAIGLVDALKRDFGEAFLITMAPVAAALEFRAGELPAARTNLSGFDYAELDDVFGENIAWYNTQFYCGWGDASSPAQYDRIVARGWRPDKVVLGLSTNPASAAGWVPDDVLRSTLLLLLQRHGSDFGGVSGWEYWNSVTSVQPFGDHTSWARLVSDVLRPPPRR